MQGSAQWPKHKARGVVSVVASKYSNKMLFVKYSRQRDNREPLRYGLEMYRAGSTSAQKVSCFSPPSVTDGSADASSCLQVVSLLLYCYLSVKPHCPASALWDWYAQASTALGTLGSGDGLLSLCTTPGGLSCWWFPSVSAECP